MRLRKLTACLLILLLAAGCAGKAERPGGTGPADEPTPPASAVPAAEPMASAEPAAEETDGWENLGYFVLYPSDGVLEVPMMGLRFPLSGEMLSNQDRLIAEVSVDYREAVLYLSMINEHTDAEDYYPYDFTFLSVWGYPEEEDYEVLTYLGRNGTFLYYAENYAEVVSLYPEYFTEQAMVMTEEESALYDALMKETAALLADAEILPLTLPVPPTPTELGEWFTSAVLWDLNGYEKSLGELIAGNRLTLLNIWGTFCGPCIREMPELADLARSYADQGFGVVGLTCDILDAAGRGQMDVLEDALAIVETTGVEYPVLILSPELMRATDLMYVPTSYFVDASGKILEGPITGSMSGEDWKMRIEALLEEAERSAETGGEG